MDESVDDSDISAPGDADMPLSIFESSCASEASVCTTDIENTVNITALKGTETERERPVGLRIDIAAAVPETVQMQT